MTEKVQVSRRAPSRPSSPSEEVQVASSTLPQEVINAAWRGETKKVIKWLKKHNVDTQHSDGTTMLQVAVRGRQPDVARECLRRGADVDMPNHEGSTALILAVPDGEPAEIQLLLDHSADVNKQTPHGLTALMCASRHNRFDVMPLLLTAQAKVDMRASTGDTALMVASTYGADKCALLLMHAGASVELENDCGDTALRCAERKGHASTQMLLQRVSTQQPKPASQIAHSQLHVELAPDQVRIRTHDGEFITVSESALRTSQKCRAAARPKSRRELLARAMRG